MGVIVLQKGGHHLLTRDCLNYIMHKKISIVRALLVGDASIEFIDKTPIKRTPGDTTIVGHN
jgi:hypothetical protein